MMRFTQIIFIGLLSGFSLALQAQQQAPSAEPPLYTTKGCLACHGLDGNTPLTPTYPKVAGQNAEYTFNQLKDFKSAARSGGQAAIMMGIVAALSEEDMQSIANYLSTTAETAAAEATTGAQAAATENPLYFDKACIACHGAQGNQPAMNAYPKIGGQTEMYLLTQMKDIKSGTRSNSHSVAMTNIMANVTDEEMAALAKWLSEQGLPAQGQ